MFPQKSKSISRKFLPGFTLVELIVVITILAILGTIGFISIGSYSSRARDSERTSDMTNLSKWFEILLSKWGTLPQPDPSMLTLTASGTVLGYQGYAGSRTLSTIGMGGKFQDPISNQYYTYSTNANQSKYQILWLLENGDNPSLALFDIPGVFTAYAGSYDTLYPLTKGTNLGILIGTGANLNQPAQKLVTAVFTGMDLTKTTTSSWYTVVFSSTDSSSTASSGTWAYTGSLFTYVYNHRADLLANKSLAGSDQGLVGYWDMETLTGTLLRDMTGNGHDGTCYHSGTIVSTGSIVDCGTPGTGPQMDVGANGKVMTFDPDVRNDNVLLEGTGTYYNFTILWKVNLSKVWVGDLNHSSLIGWPECNSGASVELLIGGETTELDLDYQIGLGRCSQYSTDYFWNKTFKAGNWAYIGIVFESWKRITYFMDGELSTSTSSYLLSKNDVFVKFPVIMPGRRKNYGSIDDVRIYNRALSDAEIQAIYNATK